jgi:hypothetical protein
MAQARIRVTLPKVLAACFTPIAGRIDHTQYWADEVQRVLAMADPSKPHPIDVLYDSFNRQVSIRFRRELISHVAVPDTALGVELPSHETVVLSLQDALRLGQQLVNLVNRVESWAQR